MKDELSKLKSQESVSNSLQEPLNEPPVFAGWHENGNPNMVNVNKQPLKPDGTLTIDQLTDKQREILSFNDLQLAKTDLTQRQEKMLAWSPTGQTLSVVGAFKASLQSYEIKIPRRYSKDMRNAKDYTACHNHPKGTSFSMEDWKAAFNCNLKELQAIGQYGQTKYLYVIERPANGWPNDIELDALYDKQKNAAMRILRSKKANREIEQITSFDVRHQTNVEMSNDLDVKYKVYAIKGAN